MKHINCYRCGRKITGDPHTRLGGDGKERNFCEEHKDGRPIK